MALGMTDLSPSSMLWWEITVTKFNKITKPSLEGGQGPSRAVVHGVSKNVSF